MNENVLADIKETLTPFCKNLRNIQVLLVLFAGEYNIKDYDNNPDLKNEIDIHFLPNQILEWSSMPEIPSNALKVFIEE